MNRSHISLCLAVMILAFVAPAAAQDPKPAEIIAKHLNSLADAPLRDRVKNMLAAGRSDFKVKVPAGKLIGKAIVVSEGKQFYFVSSFNSLEYPYEKIGLFGGKPDVQFITPGVRSPLGTFLLDNKIILSDGVFGGAISRGWALSDSDLEISRFSNAGKKKVAGREAYVLSYAPKGMSSEFSIKLFFDAETFRHVRTEYLKSIPPRDYKAGTMGQGLQNGSKNYMYEEFSDFRETEGLTLPFSYKIYLSLELPTGTNDFEWNFSFVQYAFNQKLDPGFFTFDLKPS